MNLDLLSKDEKQIGAILRGIRKSKMGTKAFSKISKMSETQILDIELARRNYTVGNLLKYTNALSLDVSNLVCPSCESNNCSVIQIPINKCADCGIEWQDI